MPGIFCLHFQKIPMNKMRYKYDSLKYKEIIHSRESSVHQAILRAILQFLKLFIIEDTEYSFMREFEDKLL